MRFDLPMTVRHPFQRKHVAHTRMQKARVHESRNAGEYLPRAFRLDFICRGDAHELVVHRHVPVQQRLTSIRGARGRAEYGDDLPVHGRAVDALQEDLAAYRVEHDGEPLAGVVITRQPCSFASWTAMCPTPPAPA